VPVPTAGSTGNTLSMTAGASANTIDLSQENAVSLNLNLTEVQPFDASGNSVQLSGSSQSVLGSAGADTLTASSGSSISGGGGSDLLMSNAASNVTLSASSGQATLQASGGSNLLLQGGKDTNLLSTTGATNVMLVRGSGNNDLLTRSGGGNNAYLFGQSGNNDSLISSGGGTGVSLIGGSGNGLYLSDTGSTNALLVGGSGNNDSLFSSGGQNVSLVGGSGGNDSLVTSGGNGLTVYGGYGNNDSLVSSGGSNITLYGVSGNFDSLAASNGSNVTAIGGTGFDNTITDTNGNADTLINGGNSLANLTTNGGTNINLFGGGGTDILAANGGSNVGLYGEDGDNTYNVNAVGGSSTSFTGFLDDLGTNGLEQSATDALESGTNTVAFPTAPAINIDLSQQTGGASVKIDRQAVATGISLYLVGPFIGVVGTPGNDFIKGDALPCSLVGGDGNDTIVAGPGGATLVAGAGNDSLVGGTGHDVYAFRGSGLGSDTITQTNANNTDAIDLSQLDGGPATLSVATTAAQAVNPSLTLTLTRANIADVIGSPQGNTLTGNARDNHFTLSSGNNTVSGGGGLTTVKFTGSALGTNVITDTAPGSDVLDFHALGTPVNVNLGQSIQHVAGGTISVSSRAVVAVVGSSFGDVLAGNPAAGATAVSLYGGGGRDSIVAGSGNDYLQAGVPQVVLLDFDTYTPLSPGNHVYTQAERDGVQQRLQAVYGSFTSSLSTGFANGFVFTQSLATAQALTRPTGGDFVTLFFNQPPAGGQADEVDFGNVDLLGAASVDASLILGQPGQPDPTSANFIQLSANLAAHELGHLSGLRHTDSFGPIGSGAYEVFDSTGKLVSGIDQALLVPAYQEPAGAQAVSVTYAGAAATAFGAETPLHVMGSPRSVGITRFDSLNNISFGEREAVRPAFDASGVKLAEQSAAHGSFAAAQDLDNLPGLVVPNTLLPGEANYGTPFAVRALAVGGHIGLDTTTGRSEDDYYSFDGHAGDYMSFEAISSVLAGNTQPVDTMLTVYDSAGNVLAFDDDELESTDSLIQDFKVPADGRYYVAVDGYAPDAAHDTAAGNYELYVYGFNTGASLGGGSTLVGGSGHDTMYGGNGNDLFTFPTGATGSATVLAGNGADVVDETAAPGETVAVVPAPPPSTITVEQGAPQALAFPTALATQSVAKGAPLHFSAAIAAPGRSITYSLAPISGQTYPTGAVIDPTTGDFFWTAGDQGPYGVELVATASDGKVATLNVAITVTDVAPTLDSIAAQTVTVGTAVSLYDGVARPVGTDTYTYAWTVPLGSQTVATGSGQSFTFTPGVAGSYGVSLTVTDQQDGLTATTTTTVTVNDVKPVVSPIPALSARAGDTVALNGYYSYPGSTSSLTLAWKVTDGGGNTVATGSGAAFSFVVPDAGAYTVTLTVTTAGGQVGSATTTVTASDVAPTAALTPGLAIAEGTSTTIALTNPSDPAPAVTAAGFRYSFALSASGLATSYATAGSALSVSFSGDEGTYTVYGRIFDKNGGYTDYNTQVVVSDPQIVPTGGFAVTATKGSDSGSQTVATFTDPGVAEATGSYAATIDWGDGHTGAGAISLSGGVFTVSGNHTYAEQGSYAATVTLTHDTLAALTVTDTATVTAPALVGTGGFSISATTAADTGSVTVATFTDPTGPDALATYSATIDWGDGHTSAGSVNLSGGVFTVQGSHVYTAAGTPTVRVMFSHQGSPDVTVKDSAVVINPALVATALPLAATRNAPTELVPVATFADPAGPDQLSAYSASITWGDGGTSSGSAVTIVFGADGRTFTVLGSHTYTTAGSYTVSVTVQHGAAPPAPTTVSSTATVSNPALVAVGGFTVTATPGVPFSGQTVATFTDPSGPDAAGSYSATIDWGDGSAATAGTISGPSGGVFTVSSGHTYAAVTNDVITVTMQHTPSPSVSVTSTAVVAPAVLLLNPTLSGALTLSGSASVALGGALIVDSSSSSAITESGSASVKAASIQEVGGYSLGGGATIGPKPTHLRAAVADPPAGLPVPPNPGGTPQSVNAGGGSSVTLSPGLYSQITVGGSATVTLKPGVYIITGGGLTVGASGSMKGSGVLICNAGSNYPATGGSYGGVTIAGSGTVSLSPATSGAYAGVVLFQPRDNVRALSLSNNAQVGVSGTVYAPAALVTVSGSAALNLPIIADRLKLTGGGSTSLAVDGADGSDGAVAGELLGGDLNVHVSDPSGLFTAAELARIQDAITSIDTEIAPYGVTVAEVGDAADANVVIDTGTTTPAGGMADGVLGCFVPDKEEITIVQGWDWYDGSDPAGIGAAQYDFQTAITHELGHALGLGHNPDAPSVMHATLDAATVKRALTDADLNIGDVDNLPGALHAGAPAARQETASPGASPSLAAVVVFSPATPAPAAAFLNVTLTPILSGGTAAVLSVAPPVLVRTAAEAGSLTPPSGAVRSDVTAPDPGLPDQPARGTGEDRPEPRTSPEPGPRELLPWPDQQDAPRTEPVDRFFTEVGGRGLLADGGALPLPSQRDPDGTSLMTAASLLAAFALRPAARPADPAAERKRWNWCRDEG
jgi:hypothetical protein